MMRYILIAIIPAIFLTSCSGLTSISKPQLISTFSNDEISLILDQDTLTPMRVYKINEKEDSILLRTKSREVVVNPDDIVLQAFVKRLYYTVRDSLSMGVGIAAPQVGILKKIIWVQRFDKEDFPFEVYINPKIVQYTKLKQDCLEGCLSIPDRKDTLETRAYAILIEYYDLENNHKTEMVEGFTAVIFQHEIDHLNGILYTDHLDKEYKATD